MKHYIDSNDKIFAFESDGSQDHLVKPDMKPITNAELAELCKPSQEELGAQRVSEIDSRLSKIDVESVRPLRAINNGNAVQKDHDRLAELDAEAEALREERAALA